MCPRNDQIFSNQIVSKHTYFILSVTVTCSIVCQEYRVGVKIPWPGYLDPIPQAFVFEIIRIPVMCPIRTQIYLACIFSPVVFEDLRLQKHKSGWGS